MLVLAWIVYAVLGTIKVQDNLFEYVCITVFALLSICISMVIVLFLRCTFWNCTCVRTCIVFSVHNSNRRTISAGLYLPIYGIFIVFAVRICFTILELYLYFPCTIQIGGQSAICSRDLGESWTQWRRERNLSKWNSC